MTTSKVFSGVVWASIQRFGTMIISFVTNIVLARLLTPGDFGTIGMLLLFLAIANTFVDSGFGSALIQKKDATQTDFSTVFYINLVLSIAIYAVLFFGAPWVANFYDVDMLNPLLRVQGLVLILNGFCIVQTALLRKKMDFRKLSISNLVGNAVGSVVGILAALNGYGVWSLVIRALTVSFVTSILLWVAGNWKPLWVFSSQSFKELFGFGGFMLLSSLLYALTNNIQTLVIGKLFKPADLGNVTQARQLRNVATDSVSSVISQVLYPEFANNQKEENILTQKLNLSVSVISFMSVGLMVLCILTAKPLILLLYGEKWVDCIPYFQILCIAGSFIALQDVNVNLVAAKGKSKMLFYCNVLKMILYILMLIVGAKLYGLYGLVIANSLYTMIAYLVFSILATHYLKENVFFQYKRLMQPIVISIVPTFITIVINKMMSEFNNNLLVFIVDIVVFTTIYVGFSYMVKNAGCLYMKAALNNLAHSRIKK